MSQREEEEEGAAPTEERTAKGPSVLDALLEDTAQSPVRATGKTEVLVGEVVDVRHPSLRGRVRVRWQDLEGQTFERWLPVLQGMPVRIADRVMLTSAANFPEHVVTGVVDGFAARPEPERSTKAAIELQRDEAVRVETKDGVPLLEVFEGDGGPVVRLLSEDVSLELSGSLRVRAQSIEIEATRGQAQIKASDDVVVQGEVIHLN